MTIYGYARVSSISQEKNYSFEVQKDQFLSVGIVEENIISEVFTGTTLERKKLMELVEKMKAGDSLVVARLDRLGRNTLECLNFIQELKRKEIDFRSLDLPFDTDPIITQLIQTLYLSFAQMETRVRRERQMLGIAKAKAEHKFLGRKSKFTEKTIKDLDEMLEKQNKINHIVKATGLSRSSVYKYLKLKKEGRVKNNKICKI